MGKRPALDRDCPKEHAVLQVALLTQATPHRGPLSMRRAPSLDRPCRCPPRGILRTTRAAPPVHGPRRMGTQRKPRQSGVPRARRPASALGADVPHCPIACPIRSPTRSAAPAQPGEVPLLAVRQRNPRKNRGGRTFPATWGRARPPPHSGDPAGGGGPRPGTGGPVRSLPRDAKSAVTPLCSSIDTRGRPPPMPRVGERIRFGLSGTFPLRLTISGWRRLNVWQDKVLPHYDVLHPQRICRCRTADDGGSSCRRSCRGRRWTDGWTGDTHPSVCPGMEHRAADRPPAD